MRIEISPLVMESIESRADVSEDVMDAILHWAGERLEQGMRTYGVPLTSHNNRDALADAWEEVFDALQYTKQAEVESKLSKFHFEYIYNRLLDCLLSLSLARLSPFAG